MPTARVPSAAFRATTVQAKKFSKQPSFLFDKVDIFIDYIDALVTLVVDLKLCIF